MANINVLIPDEIHEKAKLKALREKTTLKDLIIRGLEEICRKK